MRAVLVLLWLPTTVLGHVACAQDLPPNAGFEEADAGRLPAMWQPRSLTRGSHGLVEEARSGDWAAQIEFTEGEGNGVSGYYYSDPQPLPACKRITVSAWVKVKSEGSGAYLRLLFQRDDAYVGLHSSAAVGDTDGEWRRLEVSAEPPPEADSWRMSVEQSGIGRAVFDDCATQIEPADLIPGATRDAVSNRPIDLGEGRFGVLGPAATPSEGLSVATSLRGRSALPPVLHLGVVWYAGDEQLGVVSTRATAWQAETRASLPVRAMAGADTLRPIVYAESRELWEAADVGLPELLAAAQAEVPPLAITPASHPRLFVTHDELADLRALLAGDPPAELADAHAQLLAVADACFDEKELVVYGGRYRTSLPPAAPERHADNFPYWTGLSREIEVRIEALATAYLLTGEPRYAELCRTWTLALCEWPQWTDPDYASPPACLDTGHFCHAVAFAYDFCYDALTDGERATVRDALLEKGADAVLQAGESGWARSMGWPNGFAVVMGGMGIAGIATLGDDDRAGEYVRYARRRLHEFLEARDRDGGYVEGLTYGGYAMSLTMPFAATLFLHGDGLLAGHPYVGQSLRFAVRCLDPASATSVNFCDATYATRAYNPVAGWRARQGDGLGRWYLQHNEGLSKLWRYTPPLSVLWHPLGIEPDSPADWPALAHYRDIGWVVMRSGFGDADFTFAMRSGYAGSHCQLDQNSFMLNAAGAWVLPDPGYGQTATNLHSTLMVDGMGQSASGGRMVASGEVGTIAYAAGDAAGCYDGLGRFTRHAIMVDRSYIVVVDEVAPADGPASVESRLVTGAETPDIADTHVGLSVDGVDCAIVIGHDAAIETIGEGGPRTLGLGFAADRPTLRPMVLLPGGDDPPISCEFAAATDAVHIRVVRGVATDHILLNVSGRPRTAKGMTSDARVACLHARNGELDRASVVWGSDVRLHGETVLASETKRDFWR